MDEATLKRAPEPFFTTKGAGKGTGLGLSMVYGLAAQSGGVARIFSRPGAGTTVELWLPLAEREARSEADLAPAAPSDAPGSCRILLVDDDALVMSAGISMLEELGHRVLSAPSAARALELLKRESRVDLVITDHAMPGMSGTELAGAPARAPPGLAGAAGDRLRRSPQRPGHHAAAPREALPPRQARRDDRGDVCRRAPTARMPVAPAADETVAAF